MFIIATLASELSPGASSGSMQKKFLMADIGIALALLAFGSILYAGGALSNWDFSLVQEAPTLMSVASIALLSDALVFFVNKKVHYHYFAWERAAEKRLVHAEDRVSQDEEECAAHVDNIIQERHQLEATQTANSPILIEARPSSNLC